MPTWNIKAAAAFVLTSILASASTPGQTVWTNPGTGDWFTVGNWSGGVPANNVCGPCDARINNGGTADVAIGQAETYYLSLGYDPGQSGHVTVRQLLAVPTRLHMDELYVGQAGTGSVTITGGELNVDRVATLGDAAGSTGTVSVSSSDAVFSQDGVGGTYLNVGGLGSGFIYVTDGAEVYANTRIGAGAGSLGIVDVSGAGSKWFGSVVVGGAGSGTMVFQNGGQMSGDLTVGNAGNGTLSLFTGSQATSTSAALGWLTGSSGSTLINGAGSKWKIVNTLTVGNLGSGLLTITEGGELDLLGATLAINPTGTVNVGTYSTTSEAIAPVFGNASSVSNAGTLNLDHNGAINLNAALTGTGTVNHKGPGTTTLGSLAGYTGSVVVNDGTLVVQNNAGAANYTLNSGTLRIENASFSPDTVSLNSGTLRLQNVTSNLNGKSIRPNPGVFVEYADSTISNGVLRSGLHYVVNTGSTSTFSGINTFPSFSMIQDGFASFEVFTLAGYLQSNNVANFDGVWNTSSGQLEVNSDINAQDFSTDGLITIHNGASLNNTVTSLTAGGGSRTTIDAGGTLNILGSTTLELNGALLVNNGTVTGTVNVNYGSLAKGTGSYDIVNVNQGGVYAPGTSPGITTAQAVNFDTFDYNTGKPVLQIELGGTTAGSQYDRLVVAGQLTLGGTLDVMLIDQPGGGGLFNPAAGQSFDILDFGSILGTFHNLQLPALAGGLTWDTTQLYTSGILSVTGTALTGDLNGDGFVGIADLNIVLGNWNQTIPPGNPLADPSGDNFVGIADLNIVLGNWNAGTPPSIASNIPEPGTLAVGLSSVIAGLRRRA